MWWVTWNLLIGPPVLLPWNPAQESYPRALPWNPCKESYPGVLPWNPTWESYPGILAWNRSWQAESWAETKLLKIVTKTLVISA